VKNVSEQIGNESLLNGEVILIAVNTGCGIQPTKSAIKVLGGTEATPHSWPWQCSIQAIFNAQHFCGCSIITQEWIISAAHCGSVLFYTENR